MERRAQVQSYVNQTEMTSEMNLQCYYVALVERHFRSKKTVNMNFLLTSLSETTIADAFLYKGNVWAHDQLSAL